MALYLARSQVSGSAAAADAVTRIVSGASSDLMCAPLGSGPIIAPEPAQRVRQHRATVPVAVKPLAVLEAVIVARIRQRLRERLVCQRPVSVRVVQIVGAVLEEHADRLLRRLADERFVVVAT